MTHCSDALGRLREGGQAVVAATDAHRATGRCTPAPACAECAPGVCCAWICCRCACGPGHAPACAAPGAQARPPGCRRTKHGHQRLKPCVHRHARARVHRERETHAQTYTRTRTRTHAHINTYTHAQRTHAHARTRTHAHARTRTHRCAWQLASTPMHTRCGA